MVDILFQELLGNVTTTVMKDTITKCVFKGTTLVPDEKEILKRILKGGKERDKTISELFQEASRKYGI